MEKDRKNQRVEKDKKVGLRVKYMTKRIDLIPLGLMLFGAYLLSQNNASGWFLIILGAYVLLDTPEGRS